MRYRRIRQYFLPIAAIHLAAQNMVRMVAALILVMAAAALAQFGVCYARAIMLTIASEPLSDKLRLAAERASTSLADFNAVLALNRMCPELGRNGRSIGLVRGYHGALAGMKSLLGRVVPSFSAWADNEMDMCTRYVAVLVDRRLRSNFEYAASVRAL